MKRVDCNVLICVLGGAVLVSCGTPGSPMPPALELAKPATDLHATRKGDKVYLAWTVPTKTSEGQRVRHLGPTRVCRSLRVDLGDCNNPVAEIPAARFPGPGAGPAKQGTPGAKVQANYTDTLSRELETQDPIAGITYAVSVLNQSGRSAGLSNPAKVPSAPTLPPPEYFTAEVGSEGVLLSWKCPTAAVAIAANPALGYRLRIHRREQGKRTDAQVSEVNFLDCVPAQSAAGQTPQPPANEPRKILDQTFEWEKRYDYRATVITIVSEPGKPEVEVEGDDTPVMQVLAHDVFPPAVPTGVQAVFSGAGQEPFVDLVWSPGTEADLAGYNIYRHQDGGQPEKLNSAPVKTPAYRDAGVQSGKKYFYSVSAVDERNNESARSEEAVEQVP